MKDKSIKVPFAIPECGNEEIEEVVAVIKSGWLTTASRCAQFEKDFAAYVGARHALAVNSATAALHLGLEALGVHNNDMVLVPTFTFTATAEVVRYLNAHPIFVDCDPKTFCITAEHIQKALDINKISLSDGRLKGLIPVHFGGHPCEMDDLLAFALKYNLEIMEDAAHALPTRYKEKLIGTLGHVTCFSFYANKTMTTGEGGMLCTDDDDIAGRVKVMRLHGINRDVWDRFSTGASWEYDVIAPGFKYNMPDTVAAIGIHQLMKVEEFRLKRQRIAETYFQALKNIPGLSLPLPDCSMKDHSWYLFMILIDPTMTKGGINRDQLIEKLAKRNIGTSVHYKPLHRMTYYKEQYNLDPSMFPNAERIFEGCVSLPIFSAMSDEQLEYVINNIKEILM